MSRWDKWVRRASKAAFGRAGPMKDVLERYPRAWCGRNMAGKYIVRNGMNEDIGSGPTALKAWEAARITALADIITK